MFSSFQLSPNSNRLKDDIDLRFANLLQMKELLSEEEYVAVYSQIISEMVILKEKLQDQVDKEFASYLMIRPASPDDFDSDVLICDMDFDILKPGSPIIAAPTKGKVTSSKGKGKAPIKPNGNPLTFHPFSFDGETVETDFDGFDRFASETYFVQRKGECGICFESVLLPSGQSEIVGARSGDKDAFEFPLCKHCYCHGCLQSWLSSEVNSSHQRYPLTCPAVGCTKILAPSQPSLPQIINQDLLTKFREKHDVVVGDAMFCPSKKCSFVIRIRDMENETKCPQCEIKVCFSCRSVSHLPHFTCEQFQALPVNVRQPEDMDLYHIAETNKWCRCPSCNIVVEKKDGCNFIRCVCGTGFCYKCGVKYQKLNANPQHNNVEGGIGNVHGVPGCQCLLFDIPDEDEQQQQQQQQAGNHNRAAMQIDFAHIMRNILAAQAAHRANEDRDVNGHRVACYGINKITERFTDRKQSLPQWLISFYDQCICHYCAREFPHLRALEQHLLMTNQHEVYMCCERTFKDKRGLESHLQRCHGH